MKNICYALLPATTSLKMPIVKKTCVTAAELHEKLQDEDMLCFTASLTVKKI